MELPVEEREQLAEDLLVDLDGDGATDVEKAWAVEIERRLAEADAGGAKAVPWTDVRAEAIEVIGRVRGR